MASLPSNHNKNLNNQMKQSWRYPASILQSREMMTLFQVMGLQSWEIYFFCSGETDKFECSRQDNKGWSRSQYMGRKRKETVDNGR